MAATDIVTLEEAEEALNITTQNHGIVLERWVTAVSELVDANCGPVVKREITDERHTGGGRIIFLRHRPVAAITTVVEYASGTATTLDAETLAAAGEYLFDADLGTITRRTSWTDTTFGSSGVLVTYTAGRYDSTDEVGDRWKSAVLAILRRMWARETPSYVRGSGGFADLVASPAAEPGTPGFFRAVQPVISELLADELLGPVVA